MENLWEYLLMLLEDKVLPDTAGLTAKQLALFKNNVVEFKQANLAREGSFHSISLFLIRWNVLCSLCLFILLFVCMKLTAIAAAHVNKVFDDGGIKWDLVVNLAGETKYSQTEEVYKENILDVSLTCGKAASARNVNKFIEVSTSQVYSADKVINPLFRWFNNNFTERQLWRRQDQAMDQTRKG